MIDRETRIIVSIIYAAIVVGYLASAGAYGGSYYELAVENAGCSEPITSPILDYGGASLCLYVSNRGGKTEVLAVNLQIYNSTTVVYEDMVYTLLLPGHEDRIEVSLPQLPPGSYNLTATLLYYVDGRLEPAGPVVLARVEAGVPNGSP